MQRRHDRYMQQRYYDPVIEMFDSVDPIGVDTSTAWNFCRYCYAANNPYGFIDPDGRATYRTYQLTNRNINTIVTDGKGGIKVYLGNTAGMGPIVREGVTRHEETHIADFHNNCDKTCGVVQGAEAGLGIGIVEPAEAAASEVRASDVEIDYLGDEKAKPRNGSEKPAIETRIRQMTQYRDSNQQIIDQQQQSNPPPPPQTQTPPPPPPPPNNADHPNATQ